MDEMTVIEHGDGGGPECLRLARRPVPQPGPGEVLVKVSAAGVNGPDIMQRQGLYPAPPGASDLLGLEISGEVIALGEGTTRWRVGDRVCALTKGGAYAEYCAVDGRHCLPIPDGVGEVDAAGLPETFFTVWSNVFHGHDVAPGARLLVHGGAGGIGTAAIQLGALKGLSVFTTAGSPEALAFCESLGAERAIDYREEDFVAIVKDAGGADIVLDIMGGDYIARNIKAARPDARIIQLAFRSGSRVEIDLMPVMLKRLTLTGSTLRPRSDAFKAAVAAELEAEVWPAFADGRVRAVTLESYPFSDAGSAHRRMEAGGLRGKILLTP